MGIIFNLDVLRQARFIKVNNRRRYRAWQSPPLGSGCARNLRVCVDWNVS